MFLPCFIIIYEQRDAKKCRKTETKWWGWQMIRKVLEILKRVLLQGEALTEQISEL